MLGAGMVGISSALHLQQRGWDVVLVDRVGPGAETSFGNAGVISRGSIMPVSYPGMLKDIPMILAGKTDAVRITPGGLFSSLGWAPAFMRNATTQRNREIARDLNALLEHCVPEHRALMEQANALSHIRDGGWLKLYRSEKGARKTVLEKELLTELGVPFETLVPEDIAELEPHLNPIYHSGIHITGTASVDDPGTVCRLYAAEFERAGGTIRISTVARLEERSDSVAVHFADGDPLVAEHVVVAMGAWSDQLLKPLGIRVPLFQERGYHRHYKPSGNAFLTRPIYDAGGAFVVTPMVKGIRVSCGVEIAAPNAPPSPVQIEAIMPAVRAAFPLAETVDDEPWFGRRPSLPDGIPAIGPARAGSRIWTNFGHQHIGFTLGPISGRLIAEMITGESPIIDPTPYRLSRF